MLQAIRDRVTGIIAIFVLGLLAVPFLFFGMESYMRSVPEDSVAIIGDAEISSSEFQTSFAQYRRQQREQLGDDYDDIEMNQPEARREHLESMIEEVLLQEYALDLGLEVGDRMIAEIIRGIEAFQVGGQFDPEAYQRVLQASGQTPASFEREMRDDILTRLIPGALSESVVVTESEIDRLMALQNETRQIAMVQIPLSRFHDEIEISEADIETYYQENPDEFTTEETVRLAYVELDVEELEVDATLSEEELRQRYEAASQRYLTPEARHASHILIEGNGDAEARARDIYQQIEDGASFEELAREHSDDPGSSDQGGDLGWIEPDDMIEGFEDALYALEEAGDVSEPVETRFGWHIIRLEDIRPPEGMSFEEAREEILEDYEMRQREELYMEMSERMIDLVYADDSSLAPLAEELDLEIEYTEAFTRAGAESGIAADSRVVEEAFSDLVLQQGAVSDPIEFDDNRQIAIKVDEHSPAEPRPLEEVADSIRDRLLEQRARERTEAYAHELAEAAGDNGSELESVAEEESLELTEHESVGRNDFQLGPNLVQDLFRLPRPGSTPAVHVLSGPDYEAVVRLEAVTEGNPATAGEQERDMMRRQIRFVRLNDEISGLIDRLREDTDIQVVEDRL